MMISMYFAVSWLEPRLQINNSATEWIEDRTGPKDVLVLLYSQNTWIFNISASQWVPRSPEISLVSWARNLRFGNLQQTEGSEGDVRSEDNEEQDDQLWAEVGWCKDPELTFYCSVHITISCQMNFDDYPLDDQACQLQVGSCKYLYWLQLSLLPCSRLRHPGGRQVPVQLHLRREETEKSAAHHTDRTTPPTFPHSPPPLRSVFSHKQSERSHFRSLLRLRVSSKASTKADAVCCSGLSS